MTTLETIPVNVIQRNAKAGLAREHFRLRLDWLVTLKARGSPSVFASLVSESGVSCSEGAVRKWIDGSEKGWIGGRHLWAICQAFDDISLDWLLGLKVTPGDSSAPGPKTQTEQFIDAQIKKGE